jgi:endonuclease YncB( thermonuclease family)
MPLFEYQVSLQRVIDGDTYVLNEIDLGFETSLRDVRLRLLDIDTAEICRPASDEEIELGHEQTAFVEEWFLDGAINYDGDQAGDRSGQYPFVLRSHRWDRDSFGRVLGHISRKCDASTHEHARELNLDLASVLFDEYGVDVLYDR